MTTIKISEGMSADDVLEVLGQPKATEVVGEEGERRRIKDVANLIVEWTYQTIKLTLARRERDDITCYRVIKMEVLE